MNKQDIYKIIGYNGVYNNNVKKAIRKLLKENHPDNGGDVDKFKIINEVKKELENHKVSIVIDKTDTTKTIDDIDYSYCENRKKELNSKKNVLIKQLDNIKNDLKLNIMEYGILYNNSLDKEILLYNNDKKENHLMILICCIITMMILSLGLLIITKKNYLLLILGLLLLLLIMCIMVFFKKIKMNTLDKNEKLKNYFDTVNEIKISKKIKKELNNQKIELERKLNQINNDIRFYDNILKNK